MGIPPHICVDCEDALSPQSSPGECPSLTESFFSTQSSGLYTDPTRRSSLVSSTSDFPEWYTNSADTTSPATPMTSMHSFGVEGQQIKTEQSLDIEHTYQVQPQGLPELDFWMITHDSGDLSHLTNMGAIPLTNGLRSSDSQPYCSSYPLYPQSMSMSNPALSRSIFGIHDPMDTVARIGEDDSSLMWSVLSTSPPQTIAPSAAFQPFLVSSPVTKYEPSTPTQTGAHSSLMFSSSPIGWMSPSIVPSQHDIDDAKYEFAEHDIDGLEFSKHRPSVDRLHRRGYERKRHLGPSGRPKTAGIRTGFACEAVITQNEFPCSYSGCGKRFKRSEHKKRHERNVHEKHKHPIHRCWVRRCGTEFSRTDNLKSHLRNTHGKNSPNQRNVYVATLDKNSEYYDPDWVERDNTRRLPGPVPVVERAR